MRISDWSSDVCSSDLDGPVGCRAGGAATDRDRCGGGENFEKVALAMKTIHTIVELRAQIAAWRAAGERIALTPTMGNLHRGHLRRSEERRAGKAGVSTWRCRWARSQYKKKHTK